MLPPNLTLIIEMIVFWLFIWATMKFVWPPLMSAIEERQIIIAAGMAASERAHKELDLAQHHISEIIKEAKQQAASIIEKANHAAIELVDEAKSKARTESQKLLSNADVSLEKEIHHATNLLNEYITELAVSGAEKILGRKVKH